MPLKLALYLAIAITTHQEPIGRGRTQWVYDSGPNKGYVCAIVQQNGPLYDTYLPAIVAPPKATNPPTLGEMVWLHFANQAEAQSTIDAYCPSAPAPTHVVNE